MYYVSEVIKDEWVCNNGEWNFTEKEIKQFDNLHDAQQFHCELNVNEDYPLTEKGWHKYCIRTRD